MKGPSERYQKHLAFRALQRRDAIRYALTQKAAEARHHRDKESPNGEA